MRLTAALDQLDMIGFVGSGFCPLVMAKVHCDGRSDSLCDKKAIVRGVHQVVTQNYLMRVIYCYCLFVIDIL